jgi:hypothetical protein
VKLDTVPPTHVEKTTHVITPTSMARLQACQLRGLCGSSGPSQSTSFGSDEFSSGVAGKGVVFSRSCVFSLLLVICPFGEAYSYSSLAAYLKDISETYLLLATFFVSLLTCHCFFFSVTKDANGISRIELLHTARRFILYSLGDLQFTTGKLFPF